MQLTHIFEVVQHSVRFQIRTGVCLVVAVCRVQVFPLKVLLVDPQGVSVVSRQVDVRLADTDDQLFVEQIARALLLHQPHGSPVYLVADRLEDVGVPLLQHQFVDQRLVVDSHLVAHSVLHNPERER